MSAARIEVLTALRDRLAKATGPDRDIDVAIAEFFGWRVMQERSGPRYWISPETPAGASILDPGYHLAFPPHVTGSLDAAVTLVPEGMWWLADASAVPAVAFQDINYRLTAEAHAQTVPLALCLARIEYELAAIAERDLKDRAQSAAPPIEPTP